MPSKITFQAWKNKDYWLGFGKIYAGKRSLENTQYVAANHLKAMQSYLTKDDLPKLERLVDQVLVGTR